MTNTSSQKTLSLFALVMINVIAVDSLRTISFGAKFGTSVLFFYLIAALLYFIPVALVTAELATTWPKLGGIYVWVKKAFGVKSGFLVVWLQWLYNVIWYPTILGVVASVLAYLIDPSLSNNRYYVFCFVVGAFWLLTILNLYGMEASSAISSFASIFGTILPMFVIILLSFVWLISSNNFSEVDFNLIPKVNGVHDVALITTIIFGLMGLEMSAVHAAEVEEPQKTYPLALLISGMIILLTLTLSSLAVTIVVPQEELSIVIGVMQAFRYFFNEIQMPFLLPVFGVFIILGAFGSVSTWIIGPTKGMLAAAKENYLPSFFAYTNASGAPRNILILQAVIVTLLSVFYVLFPEIEEAYLLLTELTAILALLMYVIFFAAAIKLRYSHKGEYRPYKIPFGNVGMWVVASTGLVTSLFALFLGFIPPSQIQISSVYSYQFYLLLGTIVSCLPAFAIHRYRG